jgi:hemolysin D
MKLQDIITIAHIRMTLVSEQMKDWLNRWVKQREAASDREFLPAILEITETPLSPITKTMINVIGGVAIVAILWSWLGHLDIYAVAQGKLQPQGRSKIVQPVETGRVVRIRVENGMGVSQGDVLAELDATEALAELNAVQKDFWSTQAEVSRRSVAIAFVKTKGVEVPEVAFDEDIPSDIRNRETSVLMADVAQLQSLQSSLEAQLNEKRAMIDRLKMTVSSREALIKILKERTDTRQTIDDKQQGYRSRVIDALQEQLREETNLATDKGQLAEATASVQSIERRLDQARADFLTEQSQKLNEASKKRDGLAQQVIKAKTKVENMVMRSPIDGVVQQLAVTTVGQVVSTGQALMTVVPAGSVREVEAMVQNGDIGFVSEGQDVVVKVDSFPFTRYGTLSGKVVKVSKEAVNMTEANALSDTVGTSKPHGTPPSYTPQQNLVFPITIRLDTDEVRMANKTVPLQAGMSVTAEIRTGDRRVIDFFMSPVTEIVSSAAHER